MAKLRTLTSNLRAAPNRCAAAKPVRHDIVERKRGSAGVADRERIRQRDGGLCQQCLAKGITALGTVVDHKRPLWAGGSDDDSNKWLLCQQPCHEEKTAREARQRAAGAFEG